MNIFYFALLRYSIERQLYASLLASCPNIADLLLAVPRQVCGILPETGVYAKIEFRLQRASTSVPNMSGYDSFVKTTVKSE